MLKSLSKTLKSFLFLSIIGMFTAASAEAPAIWGSKHFVPYMPYSATASQIIYVTNDSEKVIDVNIKAFDDKGNKYELGKIAEANAKSVKKITAQVNQKLGELGFYGGKVAFEITTASPDITVYTSYNAGSVRGYVDTKKTYILSNPNPVTETETE